MTQTGGRRLQLHLHATASKNYDLYTLTDSHPPWNYASGRNKASATSAHPGQPGSDYRDVRQRS